MALLLGETIRIAKEDGAISERQLSRVSVDTTVQIKAITHPTDSHLLDSFLKTGEYLLL